MRHWRTHMHVHTENKLIETEDIEIQCGILFQGDSLSPLLFFICLIPLTEQLNRLNTGYEHKTNTKISHLLYMDDLKLIGKSEEELYLVRRCLKLSR
jgi:hypothetical protein